MPRPIYLDYAASAPISPLARRVFLKALAVFGNPGSTHSFGQAAITLLDQARDEALRAIGIKDSSRFREVVFTGSATEANNLAINGVLEKAVGSKIDRFNSKVKIIISSIEHDSVYEVAQYLVERGVEVVFVPVDVCGLVDTERIEREIDEHTALVSVMYVNNEVGSVQPIQKIAQIIRDWKSKQSNASPYPIFHTDAVQAFSGFDCNPDLLGVDLMTLSAHKLGGFKGSGLLYVKTGTPISGIILGGGQEFDLRSGTEAVPTIISFTSVLTDVAKNRSREAQRLNALRTKLLRGIKKIVPAVIENGGGAPHILSLRFPHHSSGDLLIRLDQLGVAASAGSACQSRSPKPSRVIGSMFPNDAHAPRESLRFSIGRETTPKDVQIALSRIKSVFCDKI